MSVRRSLEALGGVVVLGLAVVWLSGGCERRIAPGESALPAAPRPPGEPVRVEETTEPSTEQASGEVASARQTSVSSRVLARIEQVRVSAGSIVEQGDVVVVLDARDLRARLAEAEQNLSAARARLQLAQSEFARVQALFASGVAAQRELDQATSELRASQAAVRALEGALADARTSLSFAEIRAPARGRVIDRLAEPGDTAMPGTPLLRIYDPGLLRVEVPVRESLVVGLHVGQPLRVQIDALGETFAGSVDEVVPFAEPGARTMLVKVRLLASDPRLIAGMFARVGIPAGERSRVLVPEAAIESIGQLRYVQVVDADGVLQRRLVTVGRAASEARVEVLSGLTPGETVWLPADAS